MNNNVATTKRLVIVEMLRVLNHRILQRMKKNLDLSFLFQTRRSRKRSTPDGIIGKLYEDYEPREPQKLMALSIQQALRKGENARDRSRHWSREIHGISFAARPAC